MAYLGSGFQYPNKRAAGVPIGRTYYRSDGSQGHSLAPYLLLASAATEQVNGRERLYACVRLVALTQLGQFMMGTARIARESITVSGAFGSDSLPLRYEELSENVRSEFRPVPADLAALYWTSVDGQSFANAIAQSWARQVGKPRYKACSCGLAPVIRVTYLDGYQRVFCAGHAVWARASAEVNAYVIEEL